MPQWDKRSFSPSSHATSPISQVNAVDLDPVVRRRIDFICHSRCVLSYEYVYLIVCFPDSSNIQESDSVEISQQVPLSDKLK